MRKSDIARFRGQFCIDQIINVIKETSSERKMKSFAENYPPYEWVYDNF